MIRDATSNINLKLRLDEQASRMEKENCTYILTEKPVGKRACCYSIKTDVWETCFWGGDGGISIAQNPV